MTVKITKTLLIVALAAVCTAAWPTACHAWSIWHPFSADEPAPRQTQRPVVRNNQQPQSTWDKMTAGTKNFFNKTGETLGLKKPEKPPKPQYAYVAPPTLQQRQPEKKSWFSSWFGPEERKKDRTVSEWMGSSKQITP